MFLWPCPFLYLGQFWLGACVCEGKLMDTSPVIMSYVVSPPILTSSEPNHGAMKLYGMQTHFRPGLVDLGTPWNPSSLLQVLSLGQFLAQLKAAFT